MNLHLGPMLSTLQRHKTAAGLIVLQIALSCAIISNAVFVIAQRIEATHQVTGLVEPGLMSVNINTIVDDPQAEASTRHDLSLLQQIPGVERVSVLNQLPFGPNSNNGGIATDPKAQSSLANAAFYMFGEGALSTLGLRLLEGRDFLPQEYQDEAALRRAAEPDVPSVIINRTLARFAFPQGSALGRTLYMFGMKGPMRIVGVVEDLARTRPEQIRQMGDYSIVVPVRPSYQSGIYALRVRAGEELTLRERVRSTLKQAAPGRIVDMPEPFSEFRDKTFTQDRYMIGTLVVVCCVLLLVTALGIVGLGSFWVTQRSRMIGTRRALGATRGQIRQYFQLENLLLSGGGVLLGVLAALAINLMLMSHYQLARLSLSYLLIGGGMLLVLGQIAVLGPARRAAALPPVAVLRS